MPRWTPRPRPCTSLTSLKPAAAAASTYSATTDAISRAAKACKSISGSIGMRIGRSYIGRRDHGFDAAAHREVADDGHPARLARRDEVVEDLVRHGLVINAAIAELDDVVLEGLELDAPRIGRISDADLAEIGESGFRTYRRELRTIDRDLVVAFGTRVRKRVERRA